MKYPSCMKYPKRVYLDFRPWLRISWDHFCDNVSIYSSFSKVNAGRNTRSPPFSHDSFARIPTAVQFAAVNASTAGRRPEFTASTNSFTRCG